MRRGDRQRECVNGSEAVRWELSFMKKLVERRQYPRFQIPGLMAYTVAKRGWPRSPVVGDIVDISLGGLSFCYRASERRTDNLSYLNILLTDGSFHLNGVRLKVISDVDSPDGELVGVANRRCGVKFVALTDKQESDLRYFIQFHTTADPEA